VVIALLAVIATGALIAYENVGDNAQAAAAANSAATIDRAIRTFKAVEGDYPNQWDVLAEQSGGSAVPFLPQASHSFLAAWNTTTVTSSSLVNALANAGITEVQTILTTAELDGIAPNRAHNESTFVGGAQEFEMIDDGVVQGLPAFLSVIPNAVCSFEGYPTDNFEATGVTSNQIQNRYADLLEGDECHAVVALGFGGDAAASTALSNVAIAQSPTYARQGVVNPETDYSRFIGLFVVATEDEDNPSQFEYLPSARLLAIIAPDGENIDSLNALAAAGQTSGDDD
jgi:type II secretory pathway pseudopilin PulG